MELKKEIEAIADYIEERIKNLTQWAEQDNDEQIRLLCNSKVSVLESVLKQLRAALISGTP